MKRLIYITYLGLLAMLLIACEKENVIPAEASSELQADNARTYYCNTYSYFTKTGVINLGNVRTDNVLVAFKPEVTKAQRLAILSNYQIFKNLEPDFLTESGDSLQVIRLKQNATCKSVETMLANLAARRQVKYATPVFNDPYASGLLWVGQTNEFLVTLTNENDYNKLRLLARATNTRIESDWGGGMYLLTTNKNSAGDVLAICSMFNRLPFIAIADPNFLMQGPVLGPKTKKLTDIKLPAIAIN